MKVLAWACACFMFLLCLALVAAIYVLNSKGVSGGPVYDGLFLVGGMTVAVVTKLLYEGQVQAHLKVEAAERSRQAESIGRLPDITSVRPDKSDRKMIV